MNSISIAANCNCGNPTVQSPAMHAGTCAVWQLTHNLTSQKPVQVAVTSEGVLHVGVWTPIRDLDTDETNARLHKAAKQWALVNGFTDQLTESTAGGWQLGNEESYTYRVFGLMGR